MIKRGFGGGRDKSAPTLPASGRLVAYKQLKPVQWSGVPLLLGEAFRSQTHQRKKFDSLILRADGIPGRQRFDDLLDFRMRQKRLLRTVQFATQHLCIDSQSVSQLPLESPRLAASGGNFLTEEIAIGQRMYMGSDGHRYFLLSIVTVGVHVPRYRFYQMLLLYLMGLTSVELLKQFLVTFESFLNHLSASLCLISGLILDGLKRAHAGKPELAITRLENRKWECSMTINADEQNNPAQP